MTSTCLGGACLQPRVHFDLKFGHKHINSGLLANLAKALAHSGALQVGALLKAYFSKELGVDPHDLVVVSIMPCVRKQGEADRVMHTTDTGAR